MGNWNITIRGVGVHHNLDKKLEADANRMAAEFVEKLKEAGHSIVAASITHGGEEDITDAGEYLRELNTGL